MLNEKMFKTFTLEDIKTKPNDFYFNTKSPDMKVIGVRIESRKINRDIFEILPEIFENINNTDAMDIRVPLTLNEIYRLVTMEKLLVNDKLASRKDKVQRCYVMHPKVASELILSLINGDNTMPDIDVVITMENGVLVMYINDGLQRIRTIAKFIAGELRICGTGTKLDNCTFNDIDDGIKRHILNRIVNIKVNHPCTMVYRSKTFATLNTTSTKMSDGEKLNAKFSDKKAFNVAIERVANVDTIARVFCGATKKSREDARMDGVSNLLYATAAYYLMEKDYGLSGCNGKTEVISKFLDSKEIADFDAEAEALFNSIYVVSDNLKTYFGEDFCRRLNLNRTMPNRGHFIPGYDPIFRTNAVNSAHVTIMFYTVMKLSDTFKTMSKSQIQEIATMIDKTFADKDFIYNYEQSVSGCVVKARIEHVWKLVVEKMNDMGVAIV